MTLRLAFQEFFSDDKVRLALVFVVLDVCLGILAAWKLGTVRLSYIADFLRNDVAFKLGPYFLVWGGAWATRMEAPQAVITRP
jgi:hypothetical protein